MPARNTIAQEKHNYNSRSLPHRFEQLKPIFITYRLKFTIPQPVIKSLNKRKTDWYAEIKNMDEKGKEQRYQEQEATFFRWYDELITKTADLPQILRQKEVCDIITQSFQFHDNQRYQLLAYCIMPNHVHVLINPLIQTNGAIYPIAHITYTWKRFTATKINKHLQNTGSLWQKESYDHLVRDEDELANTIEYIIQNPVKAGLVDKWENWYGTWMR